MFKRTLSMLLVLCMVFTMAPLSVFAADTTNDNSESSGTYITDADFTDATDDESGEGWTWANESKTLTLSGTAVTTAIKLPENSTIVVSEGTENSIVVTDVVPVTTSGTLTISGSGKLTITTDSMSHTVAGAEKITVNGTELTTYGFAGLSARDVEISNAKVDIKGFGHGFYYNGTTGSTSVVLNNVSGSITSEADCGIELYMEYNSDNSADNMDNAYVQITNCNDLTINGELTRTDKDNSSGHRSAIWVYTRDAETNAYVDIDDSNVVINGSGGGIYVNSHSDNSEESDDASGAWVDIDNSTVEVDSATYTWAAIFVNNNGTGAKATADVNITDSTVSAKAVHVGIMTSTKDAASTVDVKNSTVTLAGDVAGIRAKAISSDAADAAITDSEIIVVGEMAMVIDEMDKGVSTDSTNASLSGSSKVTYASTGVAQVGETKYGTIDEAITNWTNNTTLTLLADVTLSDVITLKSTEMHTLDLGTYTMTAASGKDAIQIENNGRTSAGYALDIKADATNPGGITATGKAIVRTTGKSGVKDRPIIRFYGGVFNASYIVYHSGSNGTNCPQFSFFGGEYNGTISTNRTLNKFYGGTFNGILMMSVDSSAYTLISGGTFKQLSNLYMSALNSDKFTIGSAKGTYDREVYVNDEGYYVVAASAPENIEATVAKTPGTNDYLKYSKVGTEGMLNYTDANVALKNNTSANVTVYVDQLDLTGTSFKGTLLLPENLTTLSVTFAEGTTPAWTVKAVAEGKDLYYTDTVANGVVTRVYSTATPVAEINGTKYTSIQDAIDAAKDGDTVKLIADMTLTDDDIVMAGSYKVMANVDGKNIILDMNGKKITVEYAGGPHLVAVIRVADGAGLTVTGDGSIDVVGENSVNVAYMFWKAGTTGYLTVENGTYHMADTADSMVYTNGHEIVTIKGGKWTLDTVNTKGDNDEPWIFNVQGAGDHSVIITGGSFNADINRQKWSNEAVVAKDHYVIEENGYWTVYEGAVAYVYEGMITGPYYVPKDVGYATFEEAVAAAAAKNDSPVTLLKDVEVTGNVVIAEGITLNCGDYAVVLAEKEATLTAAEGVNVTTTVDGYEVVYEDGVYKVVSYVAQVGETKYTNLKTALEACTNGETVKLIADIIYDADDVVSAHGGSTGFGKYDQFNPSIIYIGGTKGATAAENQPSNVNAVLDLNGHTITNNADAYLFLIMDNAKVTFTDSVGSGAVIGTSDDYPAIWACGTDTLVTIESGKYTTANDEGLMWSTHAGDLVITGGDFSTTADDASLLIMLNSQKYDNPNYFLDGVATVSISGGTFHGFNPEKVGDDYGASSIEDIKFVDGCADGYMAVDNGNGTWTVADNKAVALNVQTGKGYGDVTDALDEAEAGQTVMMLKNCTESILMVPASVTLDLNGNYITVDYAVIAFGDIIDSAETAGGIKISNDTKEARTSLLATNKYLPIYDTTDGCYRFFEYEFVFKGEKKDSTNSIKYGVALRFENLDAYNVIAESENTGLTISFNLVLNDSDDSKFVFTYSNTMFKEWGPAAYTYYSSGNTKDFVLTMKVIGTDNLPEGTTLAMTPSIESDTGVAANASTNS